MKKYLVVDDEALNSKLLREILYGSAWCDCAYNGADALKLFEVAFETNNPYELILLDISMPGMDGVEVLERIREYENERGILLGRGVPIIMVTALKEHFMKAFNKGADDYVIKPIDQDALHQKIGAALSKK